jgi:hypothetical protein
MCVGLLAFLFFLKYNGTAIPLKELWFVLSILIIIAGVYILAKYKFQRLLIQRRNSNGNRIAEIERLKRIGHKIRLTLDNAEVKSRSYQQEIINDGFPSRIEMLDSLYDNNRNHKTELVQQTYIVYYKKFNDEIYKFVSQATTQNVDEVKRNIDSQKGIDLYIDPQNPTNYYFDFSF